MPRPNNSQWSHLHVLLALHNTMNALYRNVANIVSMFPVLAKEQGVSIPREQLTLNEDMRKYLRQIGDDKLNKMYAAAMDEQENLPKYLAALKKIEEYTTAKAKELESKGGSKKFSRSIHKQMSAVVVPTTPSGTPQPAGATAVTQMKGGALLLSPLPLGGGKRRKTKKGKKVPKKVLRLFKPGSAKKLTKMMKGGEDAMEEVSGDGMGAEEGGRKKTRRGSRKSRRHGFLY